MLHQDEGQPRWTKDNAVSQLGQHPRILIRSTPKAGRMAAVTLSAPTLRGFDAS